MARAVVTGRSVTIVFIVPDLSLGLFGAVAERGAGRGATPQVRPPRRRLDGKRRPGDRRWSSGAELRRRDHPAVARRGPRRRALNKPDLVADRDPRARARRRRGARLRAQPRRARPHHRPIGRHRDHGSRPDQLVLRAHLPGRAVARGATSGTRCSSSTQGRAGRTRPSCCVRSRAGSPGSSCVDRRRAYPPSPFGVPIVYVNRRVRGSHCVILDPHSMVRMQIDHLVQLGHERIDVIAGPKDIWATATATAHAERLAADHDLQVAARRADRLRQRGGGRRGVRRPVDRDRLLQRRQAFGVVGRITRAGRPGARGRERDRDPTTHPAASSSRRR